ncbi:hypothetical protein HQ585_21000 [candidate division KSB1 bacterium]|nr:hypothetical protein [candidate division KSB1 bacterium]
MKFAKERANKIMQGIQTRTTLFVLRPLLTSQYPEMADHVNFIYSKYQDWRRRIGAGKPILQEIDGRSEESFKELRDRYGLVIRNMRKKL